MNRSPLTVALAALCGLAPLVAALDAGAAPLRSHLTSTADAAVIQVVGKALAPSRGGRQQAGEDDGLTCNSNSGGGGMECVDALTALCDLGKGGMSSEPGGGETCAPPPASPQSDD